MRTYRLLDAGDVRHLVNPREHDAVKLLPWSRAVGGAIAFHAPTTAREQVPDLRDLVVATWNVHGSHGLIAEFIARIRQGEFTSGRRPGGIVCLLQEALRIGEAPDWQPGMRKSMRIRGTNPKGPDIVDVARELELGLVFVPSMRNGKPQKEERGNAILTNLTFEDPIEFDLPFRRERRVGVGAIAKLRRGAATIALRFLGVHLDPFDARERGYLLSSPRLEQARAIVDYAKTLEAGVDGMILGGDLNTLGLQALESAPGLLRAYFPDNELDDKRPTFSHRRLDWLFFRLPRNLVGDTRRTDSQFGSDHYPLIATVREP